MDAATDDKTLVSLAVAGELSAFDKLARRYQPDLLRFLRRRLPSADVEDAAQDVLVRAYQRLGQCHTAFRAWLLMIAYRETIDRLRKPKLKIVPEDDPPSDDDPAEPAMAGEEREKLWAVARRTLSDEQFTAVWLFYGDDLDAKEIAGVLGKSWVAVKVMLHRARRTLKEAMEEMDVADRIPVGASKMKAGEP